TVFWACAVLLATTALLARSIARRIVGPFGGACAAALVLLCGPLTWAFLSGMEVALAGFLLLASAACLLRDGGGGAPKRSQLGLLALTSVARPEARVLVGLFVVGFALRNVAQKRVRRGLVWLLPLALPLCVGLCNRVWAGHFAPNTAVAKSHFFMPSF